jgi:hypothetical protein
MKNIIILIVIGVLFMIIFNVLRLNHSEIITIKVTGTERITETSGSGKDLSVTSKYLVFTENETFENTDETFVGKWNSSDFQGKFAKDSTYKVKVVGWRIPFASTYRNIVQIIP